MESSDGRKSSQDKQASTESFTKKDAICAKQSLSTSSSENVQSMIIRVLDDIVVRVSESETTTKQTEKKESNSETKSIKSSKSSKSSKSDKRSSRRKENVKKKLNQDSAVDKDELRIQIEDETKAESSKRAQLEQLENQPEVEKEDEVDANKTEKEDEQKSEQKDRQINEQVDEQVDEQKSNLISEEQKQQLLAQFSGLNSSPTLDDQYMDDELLLNRQNMSPDEYNPIFDYIGGQDYWHQSAIIETEHGNVPVCEKMMIVQSMPNMANANKLKQSQKPPNVLNVLASRSPSQINVSEVEKGAFSKYENELLCKIHARSRIARQLRKKSRRESKQFALPSGYKVAYSSINAQNRSYKFNKSKHHYQPPVQFQRSLSCSVAVLNSLSLPSRHHSKRFHHHDSLVSSDSSGKKSLFSHKRPKLNFHQILTLICLASLAFASQCSMSILAPFYPLESSKKGVTESISGLVFSIHAFTVMVASPMFGVITPKLGAKRVLLTGILGSASAIVAFGALDYVQDTTLFITFCFLVRICEALGSCAFSTVSYIYIMNEFQNDVGWAFGLLETFVGLGMSLGPGIGGGLYGIGGYPLPFYLLGVATFLIFPLACYALKDLSSDELTKLQNGNKSQSNSSDNVTTSSSYGSLNDSEFSISTSGSYQEQLTYWKLIKMPSVLIISLVIIVISQSQGFLDPTVEPHLRSFGIKPWLVGIAFLAMSSAYAFCSPFVGYFASKTKNKFIIMLFGLAITFIGLILVGPTTIISNTPTIYYSFSGMIVIGIGFAVSFIPTFEAILIVAVKNEHYDDNIITYSIVSGYWGSMFALGETLGPIIGGFTSEKLDFPAASTIMAIICFIAVILVVVAVFIGEMQSEDSDSSIESSYSSNDTESSSFDTKKKKLGDAKNYQSKLYDTFADEQEETYNEKSYLLA